LASPVATAVRAVLDRHPRDRVSTLVFAAPAPSVAALLPGRGSDVPADDNARAQLAQIEEMPKGADEAREARRIAARQEREAADQARRREIGEQVRRYQAAAPSINPVPA
jgi:hypothetical protein